MNRIKRLSMEVLSKHKSKFGQDFSDNKKALDEVAVIRSKGLKNKIAGYITRYIKREVHDAELKRAQEVEEEQAVAEAKVSEKPAQSAEDTALEATETPADAPVAEIDKSAEIQPAPETETPADAPAEPTPETKPAEEPDYGYPPVVNGIVEPTPETEPAEEPAPETETPADAPAEPEVTIKPPFSEQGTTETPTDAPEEPAPETETPADAPEEPEKTA